MPNATVMLVENAERFGLAQLHQLRGRIGRGEHASWCVLFDASQPDPKAVYHGLYAVDGSIVPNALAVNPTLTITALESWCDRDHWIGGLPVADATPMLFRMGPGERIPEDFAIGLCRSSLGVSTDEVPARVPRGNAVAPCW